MAEYIERNALIAEFKRLTLGENSLVERLFADGVYAVMEKFPAGDVVEVRHGRWVEDERTYPGPGLANNLCSVCGEIAGAWKEGLAPERKWSYCPACGALMDGKEDEHEAD